MHQYARNDQICQLYTGGMTMAALAERFQLSTPRIMQILHQGGMSKQDRATPLSKRLAFTGIHLSVGVKEAVRQVAKDSEMSMSEFIAHVVTQELDRRGVRIKEPLSNEIDVPLPLE